VRVRKSLKQSKFHSVIIAGLTKIFRTLQNAGVYCRLPNPNKKTTKGLGDDFITIELEIPLHKKMLPEIKIISGSILSSKF